MNRRELFTSFASKREPRAPVMAFNKADLFTNASVVTHEGKKVKFYEDLCKGKQVFVNTMYSRCVGGCPIVTSNLVRAYKALKGRMGKDLFMVSISIKPEEDTPASLKDYAEMHRALLPGWTFVTGDQYDIDTIRYRMFTWEHIKFDLDLDLHTSMLRILNDNTNAWVMIDPHVSTYTVLEHVRMVDSPRSYEQQV
ncbi:MAG: SCO family protein, partial [Blastocatellia bacterium]